VAVGVRVGVDVAVAVGVDVEAGVAVEVRVAVGVSVGVEVKVLVGVVTIRGSMCAAISVSGGMDGSRSRKLGGTGGRPSRRRLT
jgi:hypothetical protein